MAGKKRPRSAIAKKMRGPVIIEPLSAPKQETMTSADTSAPPLPPSIGIRSAAVAATRREVAISGNGTR